MLPLIAIRMAGQVGYIAVPLCLLLLQVVQNLLRCENRCKKISELDRATRERCLIGQ